ncbi:hypothetical protein [Acinetobacter ursingii]|uniref:hypothetical protein n=1 Tax=Acinetobacter ursingii TaxID=108980 RepID=UPI001D179951|nr:hypothetical protein [Acinetobacter ursingii]
MAELFAFLFFIVFIVTCVFMAKPSLSQFKNRHALTRKQIALYGFGTCFVLFALIGIFAPKPPVSTTSVANDKKIEPVTVEPKVEKADTVKAESVKVEENLGMTPEEFRKKFNAELKKHEIDFIRPLGEFDIKNGNVRDSFTVQFSTDLGITGTVNKDGMLREVLVIMTNSSEAENPVPSLFVVTGNISNILSNNSKQGTESLVDLIKKAMEGMKNKENTHSKVIGNVKYYAIASPEMGLWVGFSPKNDD